MVHVSVPKGNNTGDDIIDNRPTFPKGANLRPCRAWLSIFTFRKSRTAGIHQSDAQLVDNQFALPCPSVSSVPKILSSESVVRSGQVTEGNGRLKKGAATNHLRDLAPPIGKVHSSSAVAFDRGGSRPGPISREFSYQPKGCDFPDIRYIL